MKVCVSCGAGFEAEGWKCPECGAEPELMDGYPAFAPELARSEAGLSEGYFRGVDSLAEGSFWYKSRQRLIIRALKKFFPEAKSFFEIGCGTGFVLSGIKEARGNLVLTGSEVTSAGLSYALKRVENARLFQMDARRIPFRDEFDVIGAFDVLEHIQEDDQVLSQMRAAARHGGGIIITAPQHKFLWSAHDVYSHHVRRYAMKELKTKARKAGFEVIFATSFVTLLLPFMMLIRLKKDRPGKAYDGTARHKMGGPVNFLLERVMDLERGVINLGVPLPFGGSLMLVARKS